MEGVWETEEDEKVISFAGEFAYNIERIDILLCMILRYYSDDIYFAIMTVTREQKKSVLLYIYTTPIK